MAQYLTVALSGAGRTRLVHRGRLGIAVPSRKLRWLVTLVEFLCPSRHERFRGHHCNLIQWEESFCFGSYLGLTPSPLTESKGPRQIGFTNRGFKVKVESGKRLCCKDRDERSPYCPVSLSWACNVYSRAASLFIRPVLWTGPI